jgi:acyl dehydratase
MRTSDRGTRYELIAHNTATASANKIHDDTVARQYGFRGGLVPGVDVYAYLTRAPAAALGLDWLERGTLRARFLSPVYEGQRVAVVAGEVAEGDDGPTMAVELHGEDGSVCASGEAGLPAAPGTGAGADSGSGDGGLPAATGEAPSPSRWPDVPPADPETRPPASPESLAPGTALAIPVHRFDADQASGYLASVRDDLPLYVEHRVAHPGWLLRDANYVLSANVQLGPWIHVESHVRHHALVHDGDQLAARAVVTREWERKGHRFVELDVGLIVGGDRVAAQVTHTAIYRPRPPDDA